MSIEWKNKTRDFHRRWKIQDTVDPEKAFETFKQRVLNLIKDIDDHMSKDVVSRFCQVMGVEEEWFNGGGREWSTNVEDAIKVANTLPDFCCVLEVALSLPMIDTYQHRYMSDDGAFSKARLLQKVKEAVALSSVDVTMSQVDDEIFFHPEGEPVLDEHLVNYVLSFLEGDAGKHFVSALKFYRQGTAEGAVESAESLRRCMEEYLRAQIGNKRGLAKNIDEMCKKMKEHGVDASVRNVVSQTVRYLDQYFNDNSKHNDGDITERDNEYLIYQTGTLLRYLHRVL